LEGEELIALAVVLLVIGLLMLVLSRDLVRLLISLEFMFSAVFLAVLHLMNNPQGYELLVAMVFTSCSELMVLVAVIAVFSKMFRTVEVKR
jgi:NADH-quinone oxidoreductase subunit K